MSYLLSLLETELGSADYRDGRYWFVCPFHADSTPSLCIIPIQSQEDKERWKCFGCGEWGDYRDFVQKFTKSTKDFLPHGIKMPTCQNAKVPRFRGGQGLASSGILAWHYSQSIALRAYQQRLWQTDTDLLGYLMDQRCLTRRTIRLAGLGANPNIYCRADGLDYTGIAIPWYDRAGQLVAINNRIFHAANKYRAEPGSRKGCIYPDLLLDPTRPVLICEGEFDCLLAQQELGPSIQCRTFGSASDLPAVRYLADLALCRRVYFAYDGDEAGQRAALRMRGLLPLGRVIALPEGMDLTDSYHQSPHFFTKTLLPQLLQ